MLDMRGFVAETNATHIFVVRGDELPTPHVVACPEGITRATILEIICVAENSDPQADLMRIIGRGEIGPMTERLSALFAARTTNEGKPVV